MAFWNRKKPYVIRAKSGTIERVNGNYRVSLMGEPITIHFHFDLKSKEETYKDFFGKKPDKYELYNKHFPPNTPSEAILEPTEKTLTAKNYRETKKQLDKVEEYYSKMLDEEIIDEIRKREINIILK